VDETYIKVKGRWVYLYRAVDKAGQTIDFYLSEHQDLKAAMTFLCQAMYHRRQSEGGTRVVRAVACPRPLCGANPMGRVGSP
jgi:transposase-like protein